MGYTYDSAEVEYIPMTKVKIDDEELAQKMEKLLDMFDDNDDVQNVYHNWDQPEEPTRTDRPGAEITKQRRGICRARFFCAPGRKIQEAGKSRNPRSSTKFGQMLGAAFQTLVRGAKLGEKQ